MRRAQIGRIEQHLQPGPAQFRDLFYQMSSDCTLFIARFSSSQCLVHEKLRLQAIHLTVSEQTNCHNWFLADQSQQEVPWEAIRLGRHVVAYRL